MAKNPEHSIPRQRGQRSIEEVAHFMRQMHFSSNRGAYAEGQHVAVSVDPHWNTDGQTIQVRITCYTFGHQRTDWTALPVYITPQKSSAGLPAIVRLNARGQAVINGLPAGNYQLSLRTTAVRSALVFTDKVEQLEEYPVDRLAAQGEEDEEPIERRVWQGEGEAGAILWTLEETEDGDIQIAFETQVEELAGHHVIFHLLDPDSRQTRYRQQLTLEPTRTPGTWEGWCSLGAQTEWQKPYELIFEVTAQGEQTEDVADDEPHK